MTALEVALFLIGFAALLFLTYVTTRYIGQKQIRSMKSKNISVIETVMIGADKRLHLVKAGQNYILIATTSKSVEFLTTVELDEEVQQEPDTTENKTLFDFRSIFEKYASMYKAKKNKGSTAVQNTDFPTDQQEEKRFKTNLNKLKTIVDKDPYQGKEDGVDVTNDK